MLLGRDTEEDWLIVVFCLVLVICQILHCGLLVLLLDMLFHVRHEGFRGPLNLRRVQLVWCAICDLGSDWGLDDRLRLLGNLF